jgi:hypothetical protein
MSPIPPPRSVERAKHWRRYVDPIPILSHVWVQEEKEGAKARHGPRTLASVGDSHMRMGADEFLHRLPPSVRPEWPFVVCLTVPTWFAFR